MRSVPDISVAALAYLGDSVLEGCVRYYLVRDRGLSSSSKLNRAALSFVTAPAQSQAMGRIEPHLTSEETGYFHRGRNSGLGHVPKSASVAEYRRATGMEVLFGALALTGQMERVYTLFRLGYGLEADFTALPACPEIPDVGRKDGLPGQPDTDVRYGYTNEGETANHEQSHR